VAKLAGLPKSVTARAEEVLGVLEKGEQGGALARLADGLPLFSAARRRAETLPPASAAEALLHDTRPNELTPREPVDLVYRPKRHLDDSARTHRISCHYGNFRVHRPPSLRGVFYMAASDSGS
jgi:hypothetical protein